MCACAYPVGLETHDAAALLKPAILSGLGGSVSRVIPDLRTTPHYHCLICAGLVLFIVLSYRPTTQTTKVEHWVSTN